MNFCGAIRVLGCCRLTECGIENTADMICVRCRRTGTSITLVTRSDWRSARALIDILVEADQVSHALKKKSAIVMNVCLVVFMCIFSEAALLFMQFGMLYRKCRKTSIRWRRGSKRDNVVTAAEVVGGAAVGVAAGDNHPGTTYCAFTIKAHQDWCCLCILLKSQDLLDCYNIVIDVALSKVLM